MALDWEPGEEDTTLVLHTPNPPVLATVFEGSVVATVGHLFAFAEDDDPKKGCLGDAPLQTPSAKVLESIRKRQSTIKHVY